MAFPDESRPSFGHLNLPTCGILAAGAPADRCGAPDVRHVNPAATNPPDEPDEPRTSPARPQLPPEIARMLRPFSLVWRVVVMLLVFNIGAALIIDAASHKKQSPTLEYRPDLPNYADHRRARALYSELTDSWHYRPVVIEGWRRREYSGRYIHIDARGRRNDPAAPRETQRSVHFFGGSTMWGTGVEDADTIAAQVARRRTGWAARNEGESGWVSRQGIDRLVNLLNQGEVPDATVFYDGVNDAFYLCNGSLSINGHMRELDERNAPENQEGHHMLRSLFAPETWLWRAITDRRKHHEPGATDRCADAAGREQVARTLLNNWSIAHDLMAARGRVFLGVLQPVAYVGHPRVDHLRRLPEDVGVGGRNLNDYDRTYYQQVYALLRQGIAERHVPWMIDATDAFDTNEFTYIDYCHVTANGNSLIAARIVGALDTLVH